MYLPDYPGIRFLVPLGFSVLFALPAFGQIAPAQEQAFERPDYRRAALELLDDDSRDDAQRLAAIAEVGPPLIPALKQRLRIASEDRPSHSESVFVLKGLLAIEHPDVTPILASAALKHRDEWVRDRALRGLAERDELETISGLVSNHLSSGLPNERRTAILALGYLERPSFEAPLYSSLVSPVPDDRQAAATALGSWSFESAFRVFSDALAADPPKNLPTALDAVRFLATRGLREPWGDAADLLYLAGGHEFRLDFSMRMVLRAGHLEPETRDRLGLLIAEENDADLRRLAGYLLQETRNAPSLAVLHRLLEDNAPEVRFQAAIALAYRGETGVIPQVLDGVASGLEPLARGRLEPLAVVVRLAAISAAAAQGSSAEDVEVWQAWWDEYGADFDPLEAQLQALDAYWNRMSGLDVSSGPLVLPSWDLIGQLGDESTAQRLLVFTGAGRRQMFPGSAEIFQALAARRPAVVDQLEAAARNRTSEERRTVFGWLRVADPDRSEAVLRDWILGEDAADRQLAFQLTRGSSDDFHRFLASLLPQSHSVQKDPLAHYRPSIYLLIRDRLDPSEFCDSVSEAVLQETLREDFVQGLLLLGHWRCPAGKDLLLEELRRKSCRGDRDLRSSIADALSYYQDVSTLPATVEHSSIHALKRSLGVDTSFRLLQALLSEVAAERLGGVAVLGAMASFRNMLGTPAQEVSFLRRRLNELAETDPEPEIRERARRVLDSLHVTEPKATPQRR